MLNKILRIMDFKCLKDCIKISFLLKSMNILKIYMNMKWLSLYILTTTTSFHKTLTKSLRLLEAITNMLLGRLQIKVSI